MLKLPTPGIRLEFDEKNFRLYAEGREVKPNLRTLADLKPVLADAEFARKVARNSKLAKRVQYYMFRGIAANPADKKIFERARVSFDVTVLPKLDLGRELNKTLGHYHEKAKCGKTYPEVYEVLEGQAVYVLQKKNEKDARDSNGKIEDVIYCMAKKGDQILIPPGYGHVTVNAGSGANGALVMANLVALQESVYSDFVKQGGAVLRVFNSGELNRNERYPLKTGLEPREWKARRIWPNGLYSAFIENPDSFDFLTKPERVLYA